MRARRLILISIASAACATSGADDPVSDGAPLICERQADCGPGESCIDGVCQLSRCTDGPYASAPPLAQETILARDAEVAVLREDGLVDATTARWRSAGVEILVGVRSGSRAVAAIGGGIEVDAGFEPVAIDAGDVDADGTDEVVAVSAAGEIAICSADTCDRYAFDAEVDVTDVAVGDVDGDLRVEPVFLRGADTLLVWNLDAEETGEPGMVSVPTPRKADRIAAIDADGSGVDAIAAASDGGWLGLANDRTSLWSLEGGAVSELASGEHRGIVDVAGGDTDGDGTEELAVLAGADVILYRDAMAGSSVLAGAGDGRALAMVDDDGDSARATLVDDDPELILGKMLPVMVLELPPYDAEHSDGRSALFAGTTETVTETLSDTVSLSVGTSLGFSGEIPLAAKGSITTTVSQTLAATRGRGTVLTIGDRFTIDADPAEGDAWAAVVVSSACFHGYRYRVDDPGGTLGGADGEIALLVPVDGNTGVMKSERYNRMAGALGLPEVEVSYRLGDPTSYPDQPSLPDGEPVPAEDAVFPEPPTYLVSDVARVGWWLSVGETESRGLSLTTSVDVSATVSLAGFTGGVSVGGGVGRDYTVTVGTDALFGGSVPPIRDLPETDRDEHAIHRFAFAPHVYRRRYADPDGNEAGYYVLAFTTSQP